MSLKELERNVFIFTLWTFLYFSLLRWFLLANWNFDIVAGWHWRYVAYQWWYGGWIISGAYYWIFVFTILLAIPLWIIGFCIVAPLPYKKMYEALFWDKIYKRKLQKIQDNDSKIRVKRKPSYREVRPKPLQYVNFQVAKPREDTSPNAFGGATERALNETQAPAFTPSPFPATMEEPVGIDLHTDANAADKPALLDENLEQIMEKAGCKVLSDVRIEDETLDYLAVSDETLYLCMKDNEPGDWLADEERFNDEEPLWFSESSHRTSPVTILTKLKDALLTKLMNGGLPFKAVPVLIKTQGNIINAEDIMSVWQDLDTIVCRTQTGAPEELPSFENAFPKENHLPTDEIFDKVKSLLT